VFSLDLILETEVEFKRLVRLAMPKNGPCLSKVMIAIVEEEYDSAPNLLL
jgi:hypothetical protein